MRQIIAAPSGDLSLLLSLTSLSLSTLRGPKNPSFHRVSNDLPAK